jgi:type IV fimbrial biogenesis protein FimT
VGTLTDSGRHGGTCGFTLIELLVTVSIVAILATLALPPMRNLVQTQHVKTGASDLQMSLFFARSEALKRAADVEVVPVGNDWKGGWNVQLADGTVLRAQRALNGQLASMPVAAGTEVTYRSDGHVSATPAAITLRIALNADVTARCVAVDLSGRPSVLIDTDGNPANGCN